MADWYFRGGPSKNRLQTCPGCRNLVNRGEEFCPFCARRLKENSGIRSVVKKFFNRPDSMTRFLIGMIAVVFLLQIIADFFLPGNYRLGGGSGLWSMLAADGMTYIRMGSNFHALVASRHEYWRWVTYCFLHIGLIHILFNCWAFRDLGRLAEHLWGRRQLFAVFILTGIGGGFLSFAWNMFLNSPKNSAGASGAICGVLGLLLGAYYRNKYHVGERLGAHLIQWTVYILVFGLVAGADNGAHIGGLVAGAALGYFLPPTSHSKTLNRDTKIWNILFRISVGLLVISVAFAVVFYLRGADFAAGAYLQSIGRAMRLGL